MIIAQNLTKRFSDVAALDQLNCHIPEGCVYGLVGANGAGKSTFLRLACGVYRPDEGSITMDGHDIYENIQLKKRFAFVPDEFWMLPQSTVRRMATFYASSYEHFDFKRFESLAHELNLPVSKPLSTFSKGMRRQAATILALSSGADHYFFDETFDGLDPVMRNLVKQKLYAEVFDRGATVIITSHSLRELEDTCDQLALLYKGGIVLESDVGDLKTSLFKLQVAFSGDYDASAFEGLEVLNINRQGSVSTLIVRGSKEKSHALLAAKAPLLLETLPLTLEEVFIYEMEALGYAFETAEGGNKQ
ncbi:MAG TPA: ABC transporter ATP-binding protein [Candidatus Limiplasma sp.]|nr:ABC transporter ATP-binding protein [Candidatus Limiplasma sp.]